MALRVPSIIKISPHYSLHAITNTSMWFEYLIFNCVDSNNGRPSTYKYRPVDENELPILLSNLIKIDQDWMVTVNKFSRVLTDFKPSERLNDIAFFPKHPSAKGPGDVKVAMINSLSREDLELAATDHTSCLPSDIVSEDGQYSLSRVPVAGIADGYYKFFVREYGMVINATFLPFYTLKDVTGVSIHDTAIAYRLFNTALKQVLPMNYISDIQYFRTEHFTIEQDDLRPEGVDVDPLKSKE